MTNHPDPLQAPIRAWLESLPAGSNVHLRDIYEHALGVPFKYIGPPYETESEWLSEVNSIIRIARILHAAGWELSTVPLGGESC